MKKHNISKVVLITILVFLLLSWILPAAYFSGEYVEQGRVQMGLFDLFNYSLTSLSYFGYIALFIVLVGGFYGILYKIPAYRSFLDKIVRLFEGREKIFVSLAIILIALAVSICGLQFGIALFIPFVVSIILLMGYDKIVAGFVTAGSISVGLIGGTFAYSNYGILVSYLNLATDYQIGVRFVILLVGIVLVIFNTLMYIKNNMKNIKIEKKTVKKIEDEEDIEKLVSAKKEEVKVSSKKSTSSSKSKKSSSSKKTTTKSSKSRKSDNKAALKDEDIIVVKENVSDYTDYIPKSVSGGHRTGSITFVFLALFILLILAFITWGENGFNVKLFDDITSNVLEFELFGFPIFGKLLGTINSFGNWTITDMFLPMALSVLLLAFIYNIKFDDILDGFVSGAKKALGPAVIVILMYTILVLVTYHPFQMSIYKAVLSSTKNFNIVTTVVTAILSGLFNSDIVYSFQAVLPYYTSLVTNADYYPTVGIIFQSMYGLTMLVAPTSLTLMAVLTYLDIPYTKWLKNVWKLLLELFIILLVIFIILTLV